MTDKFAYHGFGKAHLRGATNETFGDINLYIGRGHLNFYPRTGLQDIAFGRGGSDFLFGRGMDDDLLGGKGATCL